jgi:hypothetical protein
VTALIDPSGPVVPWITTVSPGWTALGVASTVRVTWVDWLVLTATVLPAAFWT